MIKIYFFFWVCFFLLCNNISAQDVHFSMPYSSLMNINPAFAGSAGCSRVVGGYRNQWPSLFANYQTSFLSYDQYVNILKGGLGISYCSDNVSEGTIKVNSISGIYAAHIPVFKNRFILCPAFEATYVQKNFSWAFLNFGNMTNPKYGFLYNTTSMRNEYADFSASVLCYNKYFYAGFSAFHLAQPSEGNNGMLPVKYVEHFGINIGNPDVSKSFSVSPSILYISQQYFRMLQVNCAAKYDKYLVGIGYRNADAILLSVGFKSRAFRVGYTYDIYDINSTRIVMGVAHEFAFSFIFSCKHHPKNFLSFSSAAF